MKNFLPIALIVIGLALGAFGYSKLDDSSTSLSVGDVELSATDEGTRTQAYVLLGISVVAVVAGIGMLKRSAS